VKRGRAVDHICRALTYLNGLARCSLACPRLVASEFRYAMRKSGSLGTPQGVHNWGRRNGVVCGDARHLAGRVSQGIVGTGTQHKEKSGT
jgi:hypothetical protein